MNRKTYNKLIRDRIPEIIKKNNAVPKVSELNDDQFKIALKEKLVEEAKELLEAKTDEEILNELSDVLQLLESIALNNNTTIVEVEKQKEKKKIERGGFERKLFLEYVDEP
ncbi:MAG: nucleoside triphosphate pyrophosphohydrolase [Candidatus Blackburnbacteria bacterium]|nr:nucleoside triphosphate pyrophosphohydrolase [Candidatus Blackburnbacteria bacterium]